MQQRGGASYAAVVAAGGAKKQEASAADARADADDPTSRTADERRAHLDVLRHAGQHVLWKSKHGDVVYLRERDELQKPPVTRTLSLTLLEPLESVFTLRPRGTREKIVLRPWRCDAVDLATNAPVADYVFPVDPGYAAEEEEVVTYLDISAKKPAVTAADRRVLWEKRTLKPGENFDGEAVPMDRELKTPVQVRTLADEVARIVAPYADAAREAPEAASKVWHALLNVPATRTRRLKGAAHQRTRAAFANAQLACAADEYLVQTASVVPETAERQRDAADPDARHVRRARKLATDGKLGKASDALAAQDPRAQDEEQKMADLRKLHPDGEAPSLRYPNGAPYRALSAAERAVVPIPSGAAFTQLVRDSISGCAPGGSGWTEELLFALCEANADVARAVAHMTRDLACGLVAPDVVDRLNACNLVGIPKPDSGTRPIALSELFLKLASKLALHHDSARLANVFGDIQFGVARPNGAETIVHETRHFVRGMTVAGCVATIDLRNAFNAISREIIWEMARDLPALRNLFAVEYAAPSLLRVVGTRQTIQSRRGTRQGTTAGPAFFCLAFHPALLAAAAVPGVRVRAYMDDVTLLCTSFEACARAVAAIGEHCTRLGVEINPAKSELLARGEPPAALCPGFKRVQVLKVLGASIGFTNEAERAHLVARTGSTFATWFRRIRKSFGPWATALLAVCGVPKATFLARTHHPDVVQPLLLDFDNNVEGVWSDWAQCEVDEATRILAHLPTKMGGMGFTRMSQVASSAYQASVDAAFAQRNGAAALKQSARVTAVNAELADHLDSLGPGLKRLRELNSHAGTATIFRDPAVRVEPAAFGAALRFRVAAPLKHTPAKVECPGCNVVFGAREFLAHSGACARVPGCNISSAHAGVKKAVMQLCHESRVQCESAEPRDVRRTTCPGCKQELVEATWSEHTKACKLYNPLTMAPPRGSGPDLRLYPRSRSDDAQPDATVLDVTHVALMTASHAGAPTAEFAQRDAAKHAKYGAACAAINNRLVVGATSENGILSRKFMSLLDDIALNSGMQSHVARKAIQAAVQVGQGRAIANAERRAGLAYLPRTAAIAAPSMTRALNPDGSDAASAPWLLAPAAAPVAPQGMIPAEQAVRLPPPSLAPAAPPPCPNSAPTPAAVSAPGTAAAAADAAAPTAAPVAAAVPSADGARERSPEPSEPAGPLPLTFGRSPVSAAAPDVKPLRVYVSGGLDASIRRAHELMQARPVFGSAINALRTSFSGSYVGPALAQIVLQLEGPPSDVDLANLRAICALTDTTDARGIVRDCTERVEDDALPPVPACATDATPVGGDASAPAAHVPEAPPAAAAASAASGDARPPAEPAVALVEEGNSVAFGRSPVRAAHEARALVGVGKPVALMMRAAHAVTDPTTPLDDTLLELMRRTIFLVRVEASADKYISRRLIMEALCDAQGVPPPHTDEGAVLGTVHWVRAALVLTELATADGVLPRPSRLSDPTTDSCGVSVGAMNVPVAPAALRETYILAAGRERRSVTELVWCLFEHPPRPQIAGSAPMHQSQATMQALLRQVRPFQQVVSGATIEAAWSSASQSRGGVPEYVAHNVLVALARTHLVTADAVLADGETVARLLTYASTRLSTLPESRAGEQGQTAPTDGASG